MQNGSPARRLIVNADDFGRSPSINRAVIQAHREGILTTASLMVNEPACDEAVALARDNPRLGVGLHLTLLCGKSALSHDQIPGLVDREGHFSNNPAGAGFRYFARPCLRDQLRAEVAAQFEKFHATGLPFDKVDGHLHLHLHPTIFPMVMEQVEKYHVRQVRWTWDPFRINASIVKGRWAWRILHAVIFQALCRSAKPTLMRKGIKFAPLVFGNLQDGHVDEAFILGLLEKLPPGNSELYSHPSLDQFKHEFDALVSPKVRAAVQARGIELIRYQDL
jgi:chitin disaccharide deacetylase